MKAGITCFSVVQSSGLEQTGPFRQFPTSVINETTPPSGPPGSAGDIYFNPDSSAVFASIKGLPAVTPVKIGTLVAYPVEGGVISTEPVDYTNSDIVLNFGAVFINETRLLLSDPASGAHLLNISEDLEITELVNIIIPGQIAVCWASYSPSLDTGYIMDSGVPSLSTVNPSSGALESPIKIDEALIGLYDGAILDEKMYVLTGANGIVVVDLKEKTQLQFLNLTGFTTRPHNQGMAVWP